MLSKSELDYILDNIEKDYSHSRRVFLIGLLLGAAVVITVEHFVSSMAAIPFVIPYALWSYAWYDRIRKIRDIMKAVVLIRERT